MPSYSPPGTKQTYPGVFFLNAGETAAISLPEDTVDYYIVECGVDPNVYDRVLVNDVEVMAAAGGEGQRKTYQSTAESINNRKRVVFDNHVNSDAIRTLTITKKLYEEDGVTPITGDTTAFTFRLYLGKENEGDLNAAYMQEYFVRDPAGFYCKWDKTSQSFVSLSKDSFDQLTEEEILAAAFHTSINGMIDKIPADYHVEIRGLLVGTKFRVEERAYEIPAGYAFLSYEREEGSYIVEEGDTENAGTIRPSQSPSVLVKNKRGFGLTAKKEWSDATFMDSHGDIYFAVFVNGVLQDGTVRCLRHPGTSVYYYFDSLEEGKALTDYKIMEVTLTGDSIVVDEDGSVTGYEEVSPIQNGDVLHVSALPKGETEPEELDYRVTYVSGEPTGAALNARTDTVTNSRHGIRLIKHRWDGQPLAGAVFALTDAAGNPVGAGQYTSDEDGLITIAYVNTGTEYTLTEISAPGGWHALETPLKFQLNSQDAAVTITQGDSDWYELTQDTAEEMASITLKNRPMELKAVKYGTGSSQSGLQPLSGAVFALLHEVTVDGQTGTRPVDGKSNLISAAETGIIPGIDQSLAAGTYYLQEKDAPEGYSILGSMIRFTITSKGEVLLDSDHSPQNVRIDSVVNEDGTQSYTIVIPNGVDETPVRLKKIGVDSGTEAVVDDNLGGAVFTIYTDAGHQTKAKGTVGGVEQILENLTSSETDGLFFDGGLASGTYYLCETTTPGGYFSAVDDVILTVGADGVSVWKNGETTPVEPDPSDGSFTVEVKNFCGYALPNTGGPGTGRMYLLGIMLMTLAGVGSMILKKKL